MVHYDHRRFRCCYPEPNHLWLPANFVIPIISTVADANDFWSRKSSAFWLIFSVALIQTYCQNRQKRPSVVCDLVFVCVFVLSVQCNSNQTNSVSIHLDFCLILHMCLHWMYRFRTNNGKKNKMFRRRCDLLIIPNGDVTVGFAEMITLKTFRHLNTPILIENRFLQTKM